MRKIKHTHEYLQAPAPERSQHNTRLGSRLGEFEFGPSVLPAWAGWLPTGFGCVVGLGHLSE